MKQGTLTLDSFKYLGLSTVVEEDEPTMKLTYLMPDIGVGLYGDAGDDAIGLDRFGRVIDQKWTNSTGSTLDDYQYAYDRDSNVVAKTNGVLGSFSETYTYSGLSQLTAVARGTNSQAFGVTSIGDITSITTNGTTLNHTVNSANQITAISGGTSLTYDANGNLRTDDEGEVLTYDGWNRLVSVASTTGTMIATYSYDGAGDLISQTEGGTTTDTYFSGAQDIETRTGVTATSSGTMATNTIYSPDYQNDVLARDSGGTRVYFTHDANYDVTAVISTAGAVDQRMAYDSYGKVSILTNSGTVTTDSYNLTHLWQGGLRDTATEMYHFGARWYSTTLQSWVSMDPARAGMNRYEPDADNPINRTDSTGLYGQITDGQGDDLFKSIYGNCGSHLLLSAQAAQTPKTSRSPSGVPASAPGTTTPEVATINMLVGNLASEDFYVRNAAQTALINMGPSIVPILVGIFKSNSDEEVKVRLQSVVQTVDPWKISVVFAAGPAVVGNRNGSVTIQIENDDWIVKANTLKAIGIATTLTVSGETATGIRAIDLSDPQVQNRLKDGAISMLLTPIKVGDSPLIIRIGGEEVGRFNAPTGF